MKNGVPPADHHHDHREHGEVGVGEPEIVSSIRLSRTRMLCDRAAGVRSKIQRQLRADMTFRKAQG